MDKIINLTGHPVIIYQLNAEPIVIPSEGQVRARYTTNKMGFLDTPLGKVPITQNVYHRSRYMPPIVQGTYYIVSRIVAELFPERNDLLITNESPNYPTLE